MSLEKMYGDFTENPNVEDLLGETMDTMERHGISPEDVLRVVVYDDEPEETWKNPVGMSWSEFADLARGVSYNNDYGWAEIRETVLVGRDFVMFRWGYDGSERWRMLDLDAPDGTRPLKILRRAHSFFRMALTHSTSLASVSVLTSTTENPVDDASSFKEDSVMSVYHLPSRNPS